MSTSPPLRTLIVDDESLARSRLRNLLADCQSPPAEVVAEAAHGEGALDQLARARFGGSPSSGSPAPASRPSPG